MDYRELLFLPLISLESKYQEKALVTTESHLKVFMISQCFLVSYQPSYHYSYTVSSTETTMGNCWPKRKVDYSQKKDRIKKWVESLPNMEVPEPTNLVRINAMSDISKLSPALSISKTCSISSSVIFFDAREYFDSEDEESAYDDAIFQEVVGDRAQWDTGRRRELPVIKTETEGVNLWNLLCKNIGKDLSKISMPVTLNEPLSTLQWLCEELEYSDLVDKAVSAFTPLERMSLVAAFAISAYGSTRARYKPFNPLLGETYECVREDKGFGYIFEKVSPHPPVYL